MSLADFLSNLLSEHLNQNISHNIENQRMQTAKSFYEIQRSKNSKSNNPLK